MGKHQHRHEAEAIAAAAAVKHAAGKHAADKKHRRRHHHRLLRLGLLAGAGYFAWKKYNEAEGDRKLWDEVTDSVK